MKIEMQKHSYLSLSGELEDETTHARNMKLLQDEMAKLKPSCINIKNLMTRTFLNRRNWILNSEVAISEITETYPCLKHLSYVSQWMHIA